MLYLYFQTMLRSSNRIVLGRHPVQPIVYIITILYMYLDKNNTQKYLESKLGNIWRDAKGSAAKV